jgi:hypothetical protein
MGRLLRINGNAVDIAVDSITAGQLKEELRRERNAWVVISTQARGLQHLSDHEVIPSEVQEISIVPAYQYGQ